MAFTAWFVEEFFLLYACVGSGVRALFHVITCLSLRSSWSSVLSYHKEITLQQHDMDPSTGKQTIYLPTYRPTRQRVRHPLANLEG